MVRSQRAEIFGNQRRKFTERREKRVKMIHLQQAHAPDAQLQQFVKEDLTPADRAFFVARGLQTWLYLVAVNWVYGPIQAFASSWDPVTMVARFNFFELCPTINEVACIVGMSPRLPPLVVMRLRDGYSKLAKKYLGSSGVNIFVNTAHIHRDSLVSTCINNVPDTGGARAFRQHAILLWVISELFFPSTTRGMIDGVCLVVLDKLLSGNNIVELILGQILKNLCYAQIAHQYHGSHVVLYIWILEHMPWPSPLPAIPSHRSVVDYYTRHPVVEFVGSGRDLFDHWGSIHIADVRWIIPQCLDRSEAFTVCFRGKHHLLLPTFDGCIEYRPERVLRQMGLQQPVPVLDRSDRAIQLYMVNRYEEVNRFRSLWSDCESANIPRVVVVGSVASWDAYFQWFSRGNFHEYVADGDIMRQDFDDDEGYWRHRFEVKEKEMEDMRRKMRFEIEAREVKYRSMESAFNILKNEEGVSGQKEANLRFYGSYTELLSQVIQAKVILNGGLPPRGIEVFTYPALRRASRQGDDEAGPSHS